LTEEILYCPQCTGKTKPAPNMVVWHRVCTRCKTKWLINSKGTWIAYNSKFKVKYRKQSVEKRQREKIKRNDEQ